MSIIELDDQQELPLIDVDEHFKYYEGPVEINGKGYTIRFTENKLDPETKIPKKIQRALFRRIGEEST